MTEHDVIDLRGVQCPANAAKALIKLSTLDKGCELEIIVDEGEPYENVKSSISVEDAYELVKEDKTGKDFWTLTYKVIA